MGYEIADRLSLTLLFNGKEFPLKPVNSFDFIHMSCSTKIGVPMCHMKIQDSSNFFSRSQDLVADAKFSISVATPKKTTKTYNFRLHSMSESRAEGGIAYEIDGYFDAPLFWLKSSSVPYVGSSRQVLAKIASDCGLKFDGSETSDKMTWHPQNDNLHEFARWVAERGYIDTKSCMQLGLDLDGTLIYKNLTEVIEPAANISVMRLQDGAIIATDFAVKNDSGSNNKTSGYADATYIQSVVTDTAIELISRANVTKNSARIMLNSAVKSVIDKSRVNFSPIDCGNVHPTYEKSLYQNRRLNNLYSLGAEVITPQETNLKLLDIINLTVEMDAQTPGLNYSGRYRIASRVVYITGANYYEKFELLRHGLNTKLAPAQF